MVFAFQGVYLDHKFTAQDTYQGLYGLIEVWKRA